MTDKIAREKVYTLDPGEIRERAQAVNTISKVC